MSSPKQILENLIKGYRKLGGLESAYDQELKDAEWLLANVSDLEAQRADELLRLQEERDTALKAYRELLIKYDKLEAKVQK